MYGRSTAAPRVRKVSAPKRLSAFGSRFVAEGAVRKNFATGGVQTLQNVKAHNSIAFNNLQDRAPLQLGPRTVNVSPTFCNTPVTRLRHTPQTLFRSNNSAQLHPGALMEKIRMLKKLSAVLAVALFAAVSLYSQGNLLINGAGATFPNPIYSKWFDDYHKANASIQINYQPVGSGAGIKQVTEGTVDFGGSDGPMNDEQMKAYQDKHGSPILHFPTVLGAAVPTYNIPGVSQTLNFTPEALAGIFLGRVTKWNDPLIAGANKGVNLPAKDIVVVHRSDGSGTTYIWSDYLSKVSDDWKNKVGKGTSINWPVGLGGKGSEGVTGLVKQTPNSIAYVELTYAAQNNIPYGTVKNSSGSFVKADLASVSAAAAGAAKEMPADFRVSITNGPGKTAYPISSFTWLLIPSKFSDAAKRDALKTFIKWALKDGQNSVEALSYAKLPKEVVAKELKALDQVQ
jgi:phosphate transport system substrate-binding protein